MKNFLNKQNLLILIIIISSIIVIIFSAKNINLNSSIKYLFPYNKTTERSISLAEKSPVSDKVIVYIEVNNSNTLQNAVMEIDKIIDNSSLSFSNAIPGIDDINQIMDYTQENSILLYPFREDNNPFTDRETKKRLEGKADYLASLSFISPSKSFFLDPLNLSFTVLNEANKSYKGKFTPMYGGVVSSDKKAYIKILKSGFFNEDYKKIKFLKELDDKIVSGSKNKGFKAFLFSSHLFFLESQTRSRNEVTIIFFVSIFLLIVIFYFFFRKFSLLLYSYVIILGGLALTFLFISIFLRQFGAIALGFGATVAGISIDYSIYYLIKRNQHSTLKSLRKEIGLSLFLGYLTTVAAFMLLPFSGIYSLKEISIFGALAITFSFLFSWFVLQNLIKPEYSPDKIRKINFMILGKKSFFAWLLINLAFASLLPFIRFEDNVFNLDMNHKELNNRLNLIKSNFNESTESIFLVFEGKNRDEILTKSYDAYNLLQKESNNLTFFAPGIFYPSKQMVEQRKKFIKANFNKKIFLDNLKNSYFSIDAFDGWITEIENIDNINLGKMPEFVENEINSMFVNYNNKEYVLIPVYSRDIAKNISLILTKNKVDFFTIDIMKDSAEALLTFEKNAFILLASSIIIIFIILFIAYRNIYHSFCAILPSISGLIACLGISVITGRNYNMMHFVSTILIAGIGVDYGIFITGAFRDGLDEESIKLTYQSVFIAALTSLSGFGVLAFCSNYSLFSLGTSMSGGLIMAFLTTYLALPFLLQKRKKKNFV